MRVLLIGHGRWGTRLRERFDVLCGPENVLIADTDPTKDPRDTHHFFLSPDTAIELVNAVVVATPIGTHYALTKKALAMRRPCLVEKPLATSTRQSNELLDLAEQGNIPLMVDDTWLYNIDCFKAITEAQELLADTSRQWRIDPPPVKIELQWNNPRKKGKDDLLWTQGPHPVSIMLMIMGELPYMVEGMEWPNLPNELCQELNSAMQISYNFPQGCTRIEMSWSYTGMFIPKRVTERHREFTVTSGNRRVVFLDEGDVTSPDALYNVCHAFIDRVNRARAGSRAFIDYHAHEVVHCLEMAEWEMRHQKG